MRRRWQTFLLVSLCGLLPATGCMLAEPAQQASQKTWRIFRPKTQDERDPTMEDNHEWDFVGEEGRGNMKRERDPDRWFKDYIQSPQASSIERNLGVD